MTVDLIMLTNPRSSAADAYRTLRTNLQFSRLDNPLKLVGISAPAEDNGKSKAAANLAVTLAQSGKRTILVDADLRKPSQHTIWGVNNTQGLTTVLLDETTLDKALFATPVDNLRLLASGTLPANPVDVLASTRMDSLLEQLKTQADIIVFDMPPVLVAADASVLGQKLDGLVLAILANKTQRDQTSRAKQQLERVNVALLGAVLLDAPVNRAANQYR